jgi:hypothetical protein
MADTRELILQRLLAIGTEIGGFAVVARNERRLDELALPAFVLLDGDEVAFDGDVPGPGQPNKRFVRLTMSPEIVFKVDRASEDVGSVLNAHRLDLIRAVLNDADLPALHTRAGHVFLQGSATQLAYGRSMAGEMAVSFGITYLLRPDLI